MTANERRVGSFFLRNEFEKRHMSQIHQIYDLLSLSDHKFVYVKQRLM